jgi:transposase
MDEINHIKYLRDKKGQSLRGIVKETGYAFETVKKYAEKEDFNVVHHQQRRRSKLDPYKAQIDEWLTNDLKEKPKQRHTAKRVYDRLRKMYGSEFKVSERTVRYYVSAKKKELYDSNDCSIPLDDHPPGEAQADFGTADFIENGERFTGLYLTLSFPYSNAGFTQVFKGQNLECLQTGLRNIFEYTGEVPEGILFDNPPTIVKKILEHGNREVTESFKRFALHYGFKSNFCNPGRGQEKGHVENKVGYSRRNFFVPVPEFKNLNEFNKNLFEEAEQDMQRKHYKKGSFIADLFAEDQAAMHKLPETPFEIGRYKKVKADKGAVSCKR